METHKSGVGGKWPRTRVPPPALVMAGRRIEWRPATRSAELRLNRQGWEQPSRAAERRAALWRGIKARRDPAVRDSCGLGAASRTAAAGARWEVAWLAGTSLLPQRHHKEDRKPHKKPGDHHSSHNLQVGEFQAWRRSGQDRRSEVMEDLR